jgi:putative SOS response-associated peptidase YedK
MRFGLTRVGKGPVFNARSETASTLATFRAAWRAQRVVVLANGFYEWAPSRPPKQPYYVRRRDARLMTFAGLWFPTTPASFVILTTEPNAVVSPFHNRMPVMLDYDEAQMWLSAPADDDAALRALMRPCPAAALESYPVSKDVNRTGCSSLRYIERVAL